MTAGCAIELRVGNTGSDTSVVEVDYEDLLTDLQVGDLITVGDGTVLMEVSDKSSDKLLATVTHGGRLSGRPGIHIPSDRLRMSTPTPADFRALDTFVELGVDMVAVSFVRSAHDIRRVGTEPHPRGRW